MSRRRPSEGLGAALRGYTGPIGAFGAWSTGRVGAIEICGLLYSAMVVAPVANPEACVLDVHASA